MSSVPTQGSWLVLHYLAAHGAPNTAQPSHDELGLSGLMDAAKRCWTFRGYADHFAQAKIDVPLDKNPWREVCGLAGSIGESLMLAAASEIEVEWHRRALANGDLPAQMSLGRRFFSESEA